MNPTGTDVPPSSTGAPSLGLLHKVEDADFASLVEDEPARVKGWLIDAHCNGWLPGWVVTFIFWLAPSLRKS